VTRSGPIVVAVLLGTAPAFAADLADLPPGSRVRVSSATLASGAVVGTLVSIDAHEVVVLARGPRDAPVRIALDEGTKVERSGSRRSQWARGAMMGGAIGAVPGLLLTFGDYSSDVHGDGPSPAAVAAMGAAGGALVGAAVGWAIKRDDWREVSLPSAGLALMPWRGGIAASVHVSWGAHRRP
jgi:hypothetical protein